MTFETGDKKKKVTIYGWWFVMAAAVWAVLSGNPHARQCSHAALDSFLSQVQQRGGSLVRCDRGECADVRTGARFSPKPDGFYLVYPDGVLSNDELREQFDQLARIMRDEEQECEVK